MLEVDSRETSETRWVSKRELLEMYRVDPSAFVSSIVGLMPTVSDLSVFK